jgi:hypothetical protein
MGSIGELSRPDNMDAKLRGARVADPKAFPASLYSRSGNELCTSTLIGPRAVLTAAHCVETGAVATFRLGGQDYRAVCERASQYPADPSADYALCAVQDRDVAGAPFERVNITASHLKVGQKPLMTGFGCTNANGTGGNNGVYMVGDESSIIRLPSNQSNNIEVQGEVALCFGDSGGPAFLVSGAQRELISVNSSVGSVGGVLTDHSHLSSTSAPVAVAFLTGWSSRNKAPICGLPGGPKAGCR